MSEAKIIGVGITDFGRFPELTEEALAQSAILEALADASAGIGDIQAFYCGNAIGASLPGQRALRELHTGGQAVYNIDNACSSGATALNAALAALKAGQYDTVLVFGMDHLSSLGGGPLPLGKSDWNNRRGMIMPALYAMRAMRYCHDHDVPLAALADVAVKNRRHGLLNPVATFCKPTTREEVLASRPIAEPLTLLQVLSGGRGRRRRCGAQHPAVQGSRGSGEGARLGGPVGTVRACPGRHDRSRDSPPAPRAWPSSRPASDRTSST